MISIDITKEGAKLAEVLFKYGFKATAQDNGYYRFKYGKRDEEILINGDVIVIDEAILVELDLDEKTTKISSKITNERNMESTGSKSFGFLPQPEQLEKFLEDEYGLEKIKDIGTRTKDNEE